MKTRFVRSVRRMGTGFGCGLAWCLGLAEFAIAQAPPIGGGTTVVSGRSLTLEWIITVVMCGVALYIVCRSSNRN